MATTMASRKALVVASFEYEDPKLRGLRAPSGDAREFADVMSDPSIGGFDVEILSNPLEYVLRRKISSFFKGAAREDFLLLHFACHGVKDEDGRLYFATADTQIDDLAATAVRSEFVNEAMLNSRSNQIVLLLDCCYSGAFSRGMTPRADDGVQLKERLHGRGRAVITASDSTEYAWEGDQLAGEGASSVFTSAIVEGLQSGNADFDKDGRVSIDDLYDYVSDRLHSESSSQTPRKWSDLAGDLYIALNPRAAEQITLPLDLVSALQSSVPAVRMGVIDELKRLAVGSHFGYAAAARQSLKDLAEGDDSRTVSSAANQVLVALGESPSLVQEEVEQDSREEEAEQQARDEEVGSRREADQRAREGEERSKKEAERRARKEERARAIKEAEQRVEEKEKARREAEQRAREEKARRDQQQIESELKRTPAGSFKGVPVSAGISALAGAALLLVAFFVKIDYFSLSVEPIYWADVLILAIWTAGAGVRLLLRRMPSSVLAPGILLGLSLYAVLAFVAVASTFLTGGTVPTGTAVLLLASAAVIFAASWLSRSPSIAYAEVTPLTLSRVGPIAIGLGSILLLLGGVLLTTKFDLGFGILAFPIAAAAASATVLALWKAPKLRALSAAAILGLGIQLAFSSIAGVAWASTNDIDLALADLMYFAGGIAFAVGGILVSLRARSSGIPLAKT